MDAITARELVTAVSGKLIKGNENEFFTGICTDSRIFEEKEVFFALKGETSDGHKFIPMAVDKGCRLCVISDEKWIEGVDECTFISVEFIIYSARNIKPEDLLKIITAMWEFL